MNRRVLIISHFQTYGFCQALYDYFKNKYKYVSIFSYDFRNDCRSRVYITNANKKELYLRPPALDCFTKNIGYLIHFIYNIINIFLYRLKNNKPESIYISNPLNFISTKIIYFKSKITYICIDFNPGGRKSIYRLLFLWLDKYCCNMSLEVICVSPVMIKVKSRLYKIGINKFRHVPVGISENEINRQIIKDADITNLLYLGSVSKKYRIDIIINLINVKIF